MTDHFHDRSQLEKLAALIRSGTRIRATEDDIRAWSENLKKLRQGPLGEIIDKLNPTEKAIPAPTPQRCALISELMYEQATQNRRTRGLPPIDSTTFDNTPPEMLLALPQGLILLIVEKYLIAKRQNIPDAHIFQSLHDSFSRILAKSDHPLGAPPSNPDLSTYVNFFIRSSEYGAMEGLTDDYIDYVTKRILTFYS